jgi:NAD(P)-dependent dehydrogenase (short-subunit alcohol dehydrogenase family)
LKATNSNRILPSPDSRLPTRFALVTGSARRLGRAIALRLAASGHFTFVHHRARDEKRRREAEAVLKAIRAAGGDGALVCGDLATAAGVSQIVRGVRAKTKRLDVLVNNVGVYKVGPLLRFDPDAFDAVLRANLTGCFRLIRALLPLMPGGKSGSKVGATAGGNIVNIGYAGLETLTGSTHNTAYLISKTGLLILTKSLAQALGPRGVRVNMVSPGILSNSVELPQNPADFVPLGVLGDVSDVADAVEFLVSDKARYITGVSLDVAGGYHLGLKSLGGPAPTRTTAKRPKRKV